MDEWDELTKEIVRRRLGPFPAPTFLTEPEATLVRTIATHLVYDDRDDILDWIVHHIDQQLRSNIGESHRKPTTPPMQALLREGLVAIDEVARALASTEFVALGTKEQFAILADLQLGQAAYVPQWDAIDQKELFKKLLEFAVTAYYSHPTIWSEIGHGGPAYPRGYYRIELGWKDPWEAKYQMSQTTGR